MHHTATNQTKAQTVNNAAPRNVPLSDGQTIDAQTFGAYVARFATNTARTGPVAAAQWFLTHNTTA